ncbi:MAG: hypothetical protein ACE5HP_09840 [Gemmatimonadota bacterium]
MMRESGVVRMRERPAVLAAGLLFLLLAAEGVTAQERGRVTVEGRAGVAFPLGELADITDAGPSFGAGVAYFFHPNVGVIGDFQASLLSPSSPDPFNVIRTTDVDLTSFGVGLVLDFPRPSMQDQPLTFRLRVINGITALSAGRSVDLSETYYTLDTGGRIGYQVSPRIEVFLGTDVYFVFTSDSETAAFFQGPNPVEPMDLAISLPITLGVKANVR